jgi:hypothetical protein
MANITICKNQDHLDMLFKVIQKNEHLIADPTNNVGMKTYQYNSRLVIANNIEFLEAIRKEMGGELINTKSLGTFLYFD